MNGVSSETLPTLFVCIHNCLVWQIGTLHSSAWMSANSVWYSSPRSSWVRVGSLASLARSWYFVTASSPPSLNPVSAK